MAASGTISRDKEDDVIIDHVTRADSEPAFRDQCETDADLQVFWKRALVSHGAFAEEIKSIDGSKTVSLFTRIRGLKYITGYQPDKEPTLAALTMLNKACNLGYYPALVARLNLFKTILEKESKKAEEKKEEAVLSDTMVGHITQIRKDAKLVGNLYWALGFFAAGDILFHVARYLLRLPGGAASIERYVPSAPIDWSWGAKFPKPCDAKEKDESPWILKILADACEYLYMAYKLNPHLHSQPLIKHYFPDGLLTAFETPKYENSEDGWKSFLKNYYASLKDNFKIPVVDGFIRLAEARADGTIAKLGLSRIENAAPTPGNGR